MNGRVLDAKLGRFLSADPYVPHPSSTQSFNRYSYVQNNPLSRVDRSGFDDWDLDGPGPYFPYDTPLPNDTYHDYGDNSRNETGGQGPGRNGRRGEGVGDHGCGGPCGHGPTALDAVPAMDESATPMLEGTGNRALDVFKGLLIGFLDSALAGAHYTPIDSDLPELGSVAELCGCDYTSPFAPASTNEEQLGRDLSPILAVATVAVTRSPAGGMRAVSAGRTFVTTRSGTTVTIPEGWVGRVADNSKGIIYQRPGATGNADMIRIMDPTDRYPSGYVRHYNQHGQPLDVLGKPGPRDATHIPLDYQGPIPGWPQ